jgi:hypothetical protein
MKLHRAQSHKAIQTFIFIPLLIGGLFTESGFCQQRSSILPDTGQTFCYDVSGNAIDCPDETSAYYGQDASYQGQPMKYQDNGDGTVTDLNTGLMWQKTPDFKRHTFDESRKYVKGLNIGGHTDWRLPNIKELYSLAHFNGELIPEGNSTPYIDTRYFDFKYDRLLFAGQYWSSTLYVKGGVQNYSKHGSLQGAFGFNFADGHIKSYETAYFYDGTKITSSDQIMVPGCYVRAVRGTTTLYDMKYVDNGDGTVTDQSTQLMWAQADSGERMDWLSALKYAKTSELAGYSDWRLPNIKELQSLVNYDKKSFPAINTKYFKVSVNSFKSTDDVYWLWSGTTQGDFKYTACYVAFGQAWSKKNSSSTTYYDWHGAGAQRSDPKSGKPEDYELASEMASDFISTKNFVRLVKNVSAE